VGHLVPERIAPALAAAAACLAASGRGAVVRTWLLTDNTEIRYETHANISEADLAAGKTPAFTVRPVVEGGTPELVIEDLPTGRRTGYIFVGRRIRLPERLPGALNVRLDYRRECSEARRAPPLTLYLFTPEGWDALSRDPRHPRVHGRWRRDALIRSAAIARGQQDTLDWTSWTSPNLAPALLRFRGREVVVALCMAAMHAGGIEWARFRRPRLELSDTPARPRRRTPRYPLKEHRTLLSETDIQRARRRCRDDANATGLRDRLVARCKPWMSRTDAQILDLIPPPDVPRAFNVSTRGCPVHGKAVYRFGTYPWKLRLDEPYKIVCPVGDEKYPSNDFAAYVRSGFRDASLLRGKYVDNGWGWKAPDGERYWLVAYACHWHWRKFVIPGVLNLSRAYLLTGDPKFAGACAVMLDRIADFYPAMEYENQSRLGWETGGRYVGKILNHIWETYTLRNFAEAYDNIFDALRDGGPLEGRFPKPCREVRANIEANILEEGIDAVHDGRIRGNFGMHQCALAMAAVVREKAPVEQELTWILRKSEGGIGDEPIEYAFYNFIFKDGMPFETSPSYCFSWVQNFVSLARILEKAGYDFYAQPKFRAMLNVFLDLVCIGKFTPAVGDAGSIKSGRIGGSIPVYREAFARYRDPRFAHALRELGAFRRPRFHTYQSLFKPGNILEDAAKIATETPPLVPRSRILDGYGMGILNNARDSVAVSIYYGVRGGHGHFDRLNFSLFAYGAKMMPDLGYPDFMNSLVPGIYTWSKNTVSHNCVVVNRHRQTGNDPGQVQAFLDGPGVHFIDVSAPGTYPEAKEYRRALVLVDTGPDSAYLVDVFTAEGGEQHDYSLHGPLGAFRIVGGTLSKPRKGTLAGENVPYAAIYDDPVLGAPNYHGPYSGYKGSGFQHLENVRTLTSDGKWWARWSLEGQADLGLQVRILNQPGQKLFVCDGRVSPVGKNPWMLTYLIARRTGRQLRSRYVSVIEPFAKTPKVLDAERIDLEGATAVRVRTTSGSDLIIVQTSEPPQMIEAGNLATDARFCFARLDAGGKLISLDMLGGALARFAGRTFAAPAGVRGEVTQVDYPRRAVKIRFTGDAAKAPASFRGRRVFFYNDKHRCVYTVRDVRSSQKALTFFLAEPEIMIGRARIVRVDAAAKRLAVNSRFAFPTIYPGAHAVNEARTVSLRVQAVERGAVLLEDPPPPDAFTDADGDGSTDAWLCDIGPGDHAVIFSELHYERPRPAE